MIEKTRLTSREMKAQVLDSMDIERERGITIKAQTATMSFKAADGETYELNLMTLQGMWTLAAKSYEAWLKKEPSLLLMQPKELKHKPWRTSI